MDIDGYAFRYSGQTRAQRLVLISQTIEDETVAARAFKLLESQLKLDANVRLYRQIFGPQQPTNQGQSSSEAPAQGANAPLNGLTRLPPASVFDEGWANATEEKNGKARDLLLERLKSANTQLHKEAIRMAYVVLAQHDSQTGDLSAALGSLVRSMDYCSSHTHTAQLSLLVLETALAIGEYTHVRDYVMKVDLTLGSTLAHEMSGTSNGNSHTEVAIKVKIASALEKMSKGDYGGAADIFSKIVRTTSSKMWEWRAVISAEDVALYAALLSLAKQGRTAIVQLSEHPEALELVPAMRQILSHFARAEYQQCCASFPTDGVISESSAIFASSVPPKADCYLQKYWPKICAMIRERCILEYIKPYQAIRLDTMAASFGTTADDLEEVLASLIGRGMVPDAPRIDTRARILTKRNVIDESVASAIESRKMHYTIAKMEERVMDDTQAMLVRLACIENNIKVKSKNRRGGSRHGPELIGADNLSDDDESDGPTFGPAGDDMMGLEDDGMMIMDGLAMDTDMNPQS